MMERPTTRRRPQDLMLLTGHSRTSVYLALEGLKRDGLLDSAGGSWLFNQKLLHNILKTETQKEI